jgi:MFS family permease
MGGNLSRPSAMGLSDALVRHGGGERWYYAFLPSKLAGGMSSPLVPLFVLNVFDLGVGAVTLATVAAGIATVPGFMLWGEYSDKQRKRREPIIVGMAVTSLALVMMAFAPDLVAFIVANLVYGFFLAATVPAATSLVMEKAPRQEWGRATGLFTRVNGLGWMVGMGVGTAYFALAPLFTDDVAVSMRLFMGVCAVVSAGSWVLAAKWIEEPKAHFDRRWFIDEAQFLRMWVFERARWVPSAMLYVFKPRVIGKARRFFPGWGRDLDRYLVSSFVLFVGIQVFYTPFPVMLHEELGMDSSRIFLVLLVSAVTSASMYTWAGREIDRLGNRRAQLKAWGVRAVLFPSFTLALAAMAVGQPLVAFAIVIAVNGATGLMFTIVNVAGMTTASELAPEPIRGEVLGAYNAIIGLGSIVGGFLGGAIAAAAGYYAVGVATAMLTVVSIMILWNLRFK